MREPLRPRITSGKLENQMPPIVEGYFTVLWTGSGKILLQYYFSFLTIAIYCNNIVIF